MDYRIIYNIQKDALKAIIDEKLRGWNISEGTEKIAIFQPRWIVFIPKKEFYLDYERIANIFREHKHLCEDMINNIRYGTKIPLMYLATTKAVLPNEAGKEKEVSLDVFEEDVASGKRIYIDAKLLKYLPDDYIHYTFCRLKDSDLIYIMDERDEIIMAVLPIRLTTSQEAMISI